MKRALALAVLAALACACAQRRLDPGSYKAGYVVEVEAPTAEAARRAAVAGFFEQFISLETARAETANLEAKVLSKARSYIVREKSMPARALGASRLRALVSFTRLGRDLNALGLVRPEGVRGKPRVLISLRESGGPRALEGRASEAMRRHLLERGYTVIDLSDPLNSQVARKTGSAQEAAAAARRLGAEVLVTGTADARPAEDQRLQGYASFQAKLSLLAQTSPALKTVAAFETESSAMDVQGPAAAEKALSSAGEISGERLHAAMAAVFQQRTEFSVVILNLGSLERVGQLLAGLRGLKPVVGAALDGLAGKDVKVRLFVDRISADELTAEILKLKQFNLNVRSVEPDFNLIELSSGEVF